ncbi:LamG domain-containing protein [Devosia pacifica]|uniref:LamG domain-containing protein n=1 Tax=Devosia pacifica TaxID=1335967 RepID=UPI00167610A0|nr:LamG domain-containing protein [Devosia pacifica]
MSLSAVPAWADCDVVPNGTTILAPETRPAGTIIYNSDHRMLQYCDGSGWIAMHGAGTGSGGCSSPTRDEGTIFYNTDHRVLQGCAGNAWQAMGPMMVPPAAGLVHHWKLDDAGAGPFVDEVGGVDCVVSGGPAASVPGRDGTAIHSAGNNDVECGVLPAAEGVARVTVAGWIKKDSAGSTVYLGNHGDNTDGFHISPNGDGEVYFAVAAPGGSPPGWWEAAGYSLDDAQWHHYVLVFDGTQSSNEMRLKGYVDGQQVDLDFVGTIPSSTPGGNQTWYLLRSVFADYTVDDVRVYDRPLGSAEVERLYLTTGGNSGEGCTAPQGNEGALFYNTRCGVMQYCDGASWIGIGKALDGPTCCPNVGDQCSDGTYYAGAIGGTDVYVSAAAHETTTTWNNGTANYTSTGFTSTTDGPGNTAGLVALADAGAPYEAAMYCDGLSAHGYDDWYLPAIAELDLIWNAGNPTGNVAEQSGYNYWSSSESNAQNAMMFGFSNGVADDDLKDDPMEWGRLIRCVRR